MSTTCWGWPVHRPDSDDGATGAVRLALLGREGHSRDMLRDGLRNAGVAPVLEADPQVLAPAALRDVAPRTILVMLDAVIEPALARFDEVLHDSAVQVIYEDAELVAQRDEWENARWLRHVLAKLNRHDDVLPPRPGTTVRPALEFETLDACLGMHLQIAAAAPASVATMTGVILVLAGMGGPDALRQLLSALPAAIDRPMLIHQRLYGGHYDHLLRQLARVSPLPVQLAVEGEEALPGRVYLLAEGIVAAATPEALRFARGEDDFAGLPAAESTVLLLSGCDVGLAEAAAAWAQGGARMVAQSPETCFDAAAARALLALGGDAAPPAALARCLYARA